METNTFGDGDERVSRRRRTLQVLETNELKTLVQTSATNTQLATSDYAPILISKNGQFHVLVLTFVYATSTSYVHAIAFSAALHGLQED